jgi:hypothetical protein
MRDTEPWLSGAMRKGRGSLSRILDCSVEGPRGAKLCVWSGEVDEGDGGVSAAALPSPGTVSPTGLLIMQTHASAQPNTF